MTNIIQSHWEHSPVICELNGYRWYLGPEAEGELTWEDAIEWCKSVGGELPPRDVLLQCYMNKSTRLLFKKVWYWASTDFIVNSAWIQGFTNGNQATNFKPYENYVRAVLAIKIGE